MKDFSHLAVKPNRSFNSENLSRALPSWSSGRSQLHSNIKGMLNLTGSSTLNPQINCVGSYRDRRLDLVDLINKGSVYTYSINPDFIFEYTDIQELVYSPPTLTATLNSETIELNLATGPEQLLTYSNTIAIETTEVNIDGPLIVNATVSAPVKGHVVEFLLDSYFKIRIEDSLSTGLQLENTYSLGYITLTSHKTGQVLKYDMIVRQGELCEYTLIEKGKYTVDTYLVRGDFTFTMDAEVNWDANFLYYRNEQAYRLGYRIGETGIDVVKYEDSNFATNEELSGLGPYETIGTIVLLDSEEAIVDDLSDYYIAKHVGGPSIKVTNGTNVWEVSSLLSDRLTVIRHDYGQILKLYLSDELPTLGTTVFINTNQDSYMDSNLRTFRMKVTNIYESVDGSIESSEFYINTQGTIGTGPGIVFYGSDIGNNGLLPRWRYTIDSVGTWHFTVEAYDDQRELWRPCGEIVATTPYAYLRSQPESSVEGLEDIFYSPEGKLMGIVDGQLVVVEEHMDIALIDYQQYLIYTTSQYDSIEVSY